MVNLLPAAFSFMLPGLGQVYQKRYVIACAAFSAFTAVSFLPQARFIIPLIALLSSFEAFVKSRQTSPRATFEEELGLVPVNEGGREGAKKKTASESKVRLYVFCSVGMIGFLGWFSFASTGFLPIGRTLQSSSQANLIANEVRECMRTLQRYPRNLSECPNQEFGKGILRDPWGRDFRYQRTESGFEVRSFGPDGVAGTRDDYRFTYR